MKERLKKKYILLGTLLIISFIIVAYFIFRKSYALENFGRLNLSCDKDVVTSGEEITCTVTGTVAPDSQVSGVESWIKLSSNLKFISFTVENDDTTSDENMWQGNGDAGYIALYRENNITGTFLIGSFKVQAINDVVNTVESISLENSIFVDDGFNNNQLENVNFEVKTPQYKSDVYDLNKEYILTSTKRIEDILKEIETEGCTAIVEDNNTNITTGIITTNSKLKITRGDTLIKTYDIIYINSNTYDLSKEYIITSNKDLLEIKNNIETINGSLSIKNEQLVLSYNNTGIKTYDIINLISEQYLIDIENKIVIMKDEITNSILDNISINNNGVINLNDNKLNISYKDNLVEEFDVLTINSNKYNIDLINKYIYILSDEVTNDILNNITTTLATKIDNNKLILSYDSVDILSLDIINISSNSYLINTIDKYIYTKNITNINEIKENISVINANIANSGNNLMVMYDDSVVDEFSVYNFSTDNVLDDNIIYIRETMEFNDFVGTITLNGLSYKMYDNSDNEITTGIIEDNYKIKFFKDSTLLDTYNIKIEYLEVSNLLIKDDNVIYDLELNDTYDNILKNFDTSGVVTILDKDKKEISKDSKVKTSDIIQIELSSKTVQYKVSVLGDNIGSGGVSVGNVAKLYQYLKGKISMDEEYILASDVTLDDNISIGDVAKLYQYLKGRIPSLK